MGKILSEKRGDLRKAVFYRFDVQYYDEVPVGRLTPEWIVVPRAPTADALLAANQPAYLWLEDSPKGEDRVETRDCPANPNHVTFRYYKALSAGAMGPRLSPFLPTLSGLFFAVTEDLRARLDSLNIRGARFDRIKIGDNPHDLKDLKLWLFQFIGRARLRPPKLVDVPNQCPHCNKDQIVCQACGYWNPYCTQCKQQMVVLDRMHKGQNDNRIPFEDDAHQYIIEGKTWDGSDLVQSRGFKFASKRFIDWLLRIHAAPFYAEPVYFCVDGMNDQQKKWFDDLQKPFDV